MSEHKENNGLLLFENLVLLTEKFILIFLLFLKFDTGIINSWGFWCNQILKHVSHSSPWDQDSFLRYGHSEALWDWCVYSPQGTFAPLSPYSGCFRTCSCWGNPVIPPKPRVQSSTVGWKLGFCTYFSHKRNRTTRNGVSCSRPTNFIWRDFCKVFFFVPIFSHFWVPVITLQWLISFPRRGNLLSFKNCKSHVLKVHCIKSI